MMLGRGALITDPASQMIRSEGKEISVEILRPWHQFADVDLGGSGPQFLQRKSASLVIIARDIKSVELRRPDQGGEVRSREGGDDRHVGRSEEHTSELQSLMRISYAVFCLKKKNKSQ